MLDQGYQANIKVR